MLNWEKGASEPENRHWPGVLRFLGYDPRPAPITLGGQVRARRIAFGLSQSVAARQLGIDPSSLLDLENGRSQTDARLLAKVLGFLGVAIIDLQGFSKRLRAYRARRGMTRAEVAQKFGVHDDTVHAWEAGRQLPRGAMLLTIMNTIQD